METIYPKGSYLVSLRPLSASTEHIIFNHCYKQTEDYDTIKPILSSFGQTQGVSQGSHRNMVRYATQEEIAEYDRLGKPYDVSTIKVNDNLIYY